MLRLFRRHRQACPQTSERYRRCACPIYVEGTLAGEYVKRSLDLTSWTAATDVVAHWNEAGQIGTAKPEVPTIADAVDKFLADVRQLPELRRCVQPRGIGRFEAAGCLSQRGVRAGAHVVRDVASEHAAQPGLVHHDHVVEATLDGPSWRC